MKLRTRADQWLTPTRNRMLAALVACGDWAAEARTQPNRLAGARLSASALGDQFCYFYDDEAFHDTDRPGFRRRVITGQNLQLCFWRIAGGSSGSFLHKHDEHEQLGIIARGQLDFRIGEQDSDERVLLRQHEFYLAAPGVWHGDSVFIGDEEYDECWILDVFSPPRDDLRESE